MSKAIHVVLGGERDNSNEECPVALIHLALDKSLIDD